MLPEHAPLEGVIGVFNEEGSALALISPDGRITLHDTAGTSAPVNLVTATGGMANGEGHLADQCQCAAWGTAVTAKGRRKQVLAVGLQSGAVRAYDVDRSRVLWTAPECHEGGVASLGFSVADGGRFFTCGPDARVAGLSATSGDTAVQFQAGSRGLTAVSASPDGSRILAASSSVAIYAADGTRTSKFTGHPNPACAAAFSPDGAYAVSAASGELSALVWDSFRRKGGALCALPLPAPAMRVFTSPLPNQSEAFACGVITEAGELLVFRVEPGAGQVHELAHIAGAKGKKGGKGVVLAASLRGSEVLLAHGPPIRPTIARVAFERGGEPVGSVALEARGGALLDDKGGVNGSGTPAAQAKPRKVVAADGGDETVRVRPPLDSRGQAKRGRGESEDEGSSEEEEDGGSGDEGMEEPGTSPDGSGAEDGEGAGFGERETTLGERVAALEEQYERLEGARPRAAAEAGADAGAGAGAGAGPSTSRAAEVREAIRADSLSVLLTQAIRAGDRALLERCLSVGQKRVVTNTVRRLLPADAAAFLRAAVARLVSRPQRGRQLTTWVRAVLSHHASYLMAAPGAQAPLATLYRAIDARAASFRGLLSLQGRLELVTAAVPEAADDVDVGWPKVEIDEAELSDAERLGDDYTESDSESGDAATSSEDDEGDGSESGSEEAD